MARGEAPSEGLHPRVATVAIVLLRNEFVTRGVGTVPDSVLIDIVDEVYLPLIRERSGTEWPSTFTPPPGPSRSAAGVLKVCRGPSF